MWFEVLNFNGKILKTPGIPETARACLHLGKAKVKVNFLFLPLLNVNGMLDLYLQTA